ncbi:hypothetical protein BpHYR1_036418 [Brachionus plicatilis]|uniref:Uncharacterized protein n=1 Tax=Brachionus plicatilis TaxID=10195 RepID=A0A3M7SJP9_BRAPC|nr:hypothetical protein BpHYR1_036418 [Brachionus plicatilis]
MRFQYMIEQFKSCLLKLFHINIYVPGIQLFFRLVEDHIVWLPPPSSFLILGLGPAYGRVMVAYNTNTLKL